MTTRPQIEPCAPEWTAPKWEDGKLINKGCGPLWSGREPPPPVGSYVRTGKRVVYVQGYFVDGDWLMLWGKAMDERHLEGNLAGLEIDDFHPEGWN